MGRNNPETRRAYMARYKQRFPCPGCGAPKSPESTTCWGCRYPDPRRPICPRCGGPKKATSKLCLACNSADIAVTQTKGTEQEVAWRAFHKAERAGKIVRPSACSRCDKTGKIEAHHHNGYAREHRLDVVFLCEPCHKAEHGKHMEA